MRTSGFGLEEVHHLGEALAPRLARRLGFDELGDRGEPLRGAEGAYGLQLRRDGVALVLLLFGAHAGVDDAALHGPPRPCQPVRSARRVAAPAASKSGPRASR